MPQETAVQFIERKSKQWETDPFVIAKDIGRETKLRFEREAWTFLGQHNLPEKVFVIERLRKLPNDGIMAYPHGWTPGDIEYRIGYYIIGRIGKAKGKWIWGQFTPIIPGEDFTRLIDKAKREGTIKVTK